MFGFFKKKKAEPMWLFVGLGNPGSKYENNRHNIGFMVMDAIAKSYGVNSYKAKFQSEMAEIRVGQEKVVLLKPQTYMNNSGQAVGTAAKFFKLEPDRIVIFHDELDLDACKTRIKCGGGTAGHNGLKSIQAHLKTPEFWRVRIGIGHPGQKSKVHSYVLNDFAKEERIWVDELVDSLSRRIEYLVEDDKNGYMSKVANDTETVRPVSKKDKKNTETLDNKAAGGA